jgi:hypothetical protein
VAFTQTKERNMGILEDVQSILKDAPTIDTSVAVDKLLSSLELPENMKMYFRPAVSSYVPIVRATCRNVAENKVFAPDKPSGREKYEMKEQAADLIRNDPRDVRLMLLTQSFSVPGKGLVTWGDATIEDHQAHIQMMGERISGIELTISRHKKAVDILTKKNATSLSMVDDLSDLID